VSFLAIFQLLSSVLAAAPGLEADVEGALNAFHVANGNDATKTQAVVDAATQLATAGAAIVAQAQAKPATQA
jgi:hypothetical protein